LQQLSAENRELILRYYDDEAGSKIDRRRELAEQFGISINTLRMRALRIRENLQRSVEKCQRQHSSNRIDNYCAPLSFNRNPLSK
jgi:DNA-directed RNA polymerase specialized sigma24 family protein